MFPKSKSWLPGGLWRPKNPHSLEHLKYLSSVLGKNQTVTENNRGLLVETLRSISEILIWGDQNDSSVFDFFLEKNMLSFFLRYMRQKSGRFLCVQLLQTLNILFENISNETSVYYLLSNNHINSIIVHKFDFSDEEVMAYYISFLKTLSLKLNKHTIHFFYNEHTNDFALYTEAIKFFNHSESMVRIAVRTITLNTYRVEDKAMLRYIRNKTAAPYFSNLVWFIGNHILDVDCCVRNDADHNSRDRLADLVAEHLDHLHYLNDILCLNIEALNEVLSDHLLNRLLIPLYVYSLKKQATIPPDSDVSPAHVRSVVALFLLSQVFLIISHAPLVRQLADIILNGNSANLKVNSEGSGQNARGQVFGFIAPSEPLAQTLESTRGQPRPPLQRAGSRSTPTDAEQPASPQQAEAAPSQADDEGEEAAVATPSGTSENQDVSSPSTDNDTDISSTNQNSTDEEKLLLGEQRQAEFSLLNRSYLEAIFNALECGDNDYEALFALCLLYALGHNKGINQELLDTVLMPTDKSETKEYYNIALVEKLIKIISLSCQNGSKVRLATLELTILLVKQLIYKNGHSFLQDRHLACLEGAREESTLLLRNFYKVWAKSEEIFLDMFEDEFREMKNRPLNVEYLTMDASILLPPLGTPLTGVEFSKRLPCGEVERARRAIRVFFLLRDLSLTLRQIEEEQLPLTKLEECVKVKDKLDLNNSDLIACTVISTREGSSPKNSAGKRRKERRFLVIDVQQLILVEPDVKRLGWGVVKFVGFLQDVEVSGDKDDSRSLHITIHKPATSSHARPIPLLSAKFVFDDHIRCMAAKQRLTKGRLRARQRKMQMIARLLELPSAMVDTMYQPQAAAYPLPGYRANNQSFPGRSQPIQRMGQSEDLPRRPQSEILQRSSAFTSVDGTQLPRFTASSQSPRQLGRPIGVARKVSQPIPIKGSQSSPDGAVRGGGEVEEAQEAQPSPQAHAFQSLNPQPPPSENKGRHSRSSSNGTDFVQEIPLEDMSKKPKPVFHSASSSDLQSRRRHVSEGALRARSSSYSPRRGGRVTAAGGGGGSGGSGSSSPHRRLSSGNSPRSSSTEVTNQSTASARPRRDRASSFPTELRSRSHSGESRATKQTSVTGQSKKGRETSFSNSPSPRPRTTSSSETCPKSLTPAKAPPSSLVPSADGNDSDFATINAPQLMPPTKPELLRSLSEPRSDQAATDNETDQVSTNSHKTKPKDIASMKPPLPTADTTAVVSPSPVKADSVVETSSDLPTSATDQLTHLAQIVQKHYDESTDSADGIKMAPVTTVKGNEDASDVITCDSDKVYKEAELATTES